MCLVDKKQFRCFEKKIPIWKVVWKDSEGFHSPFQKTKSPAYMRSHLKIVEGYIPEDTRYAIDEDGISICARKMILNI